MRFVGEHGGDLAAEHHHDPIGQPQEFVEIGRDEQHRCAAFGGVDEVTADKAPPKVAASGRPETDRYCAGL